MEYHKRVEKAKVVKNRRKGIGQVIDLINSLIKDVGELCRAGTT